MKVTFLKLAKETKDMLYVVIVSRYQGKWIFVRQKSKTTWEIPGGHIEASESPEIAAKRELKEETGATKYDLIHICDFLVSDNNVDYNNRSRLYFAEVFELGELGNFEIEEIKLCNEIPHNLTHKEIQPILFKKVIKEIARKSAH